MWLNQNSTLQHYTQYTAIELRGCVKELQRLCNNAHGSTLPAVREKYSQHKVSFFCLEEGLKNDDLSCVYVINDGFVFFILAV